MMVEPRHGSIPRWYNKDCKYEEAFHENTPNSRTTNHTIEKLLKKYKAKTVLDLTWDRFTGFLVAKARL